jgi:SAM-dependent methyltransferase
VLDVATGYGEPGLTAARAVAPGGHVVCTDISAEMLAVGRERAAAAGLDNLEFLELDSEELAFGEARFDAVLSRQGLQFLPDVAGVLARLHSFLKPDGRLAAAVWGPPQTVQFAAPVPVIRAELQLPPPPAGIPGPFALADTDQLVGLVEAAGFTDVETGEPGGLGDRDQVGLIPACCCGSRSRQTRAQASSTNAKHRSEPRSHRTCSRR